MAARLILDRFKPELAVSCGFGGGLTTGLPPGAVIQAERVVLYDPTSNVLGESLEVPRPETRIALSDVRPGTVVTAERPPDKKMLSRLLPPFFHPAVVDMETYHTARIFLEAQVAFFSLRSVCDELDYEPGLELEHIIDGFGRVNAFKACAYCLRRPGKAARFPALARRSALAAEVLSRVLQEILEHI
jgi:nucleoside phosphorylase